MTSQRIMDLALLIPALPFAAPLIGVLALVVWIVDGRPVFFRQPRIGRGGGTFTVWKLRTMTLEADARHRRPTRLGRWLRVRGLDELPQLFAILVGDMALVGPRPLTPADSERLTREHPPFAARLRLRPGLTGPAQVAGTRGAAAVAAVEAHYGAGRGVAVDLGILARTVWVNVVGRRR